MGNTIYITDLTIYSKSHAMVYDRYNIKDGYIIDSTDAYKLVINKEGIEIFYKDTIGRVSYTLKKTG